MLFHCFYDSKNLFQNISKMLSQNLFCSNFAIIEAIMAGTYSLKPFLENTPGTEKHKNK